MGREHALLLGKRGAKVVVNDLGENSAVSQPGKEIAKERVAELVANEIIAQGGEAVPNFDSVEHGDKIVQTAIEAFGRVDILVCNAGTATSAPVDKVPDAIWDHQMMVLNVLEWPTIYICLHHARLSAKRYTSRARSHALRPRGRT